MGQIILERQEGYKFEKRLSLFGPHSSTVISSQGRECFEKELDQTNVGFFFFLNAKCFRCRCHYTQKTKQKTKTKNLFVGKQTQATSIF